MAAVPFGCEAASPSCARSVQAPIVPSACDARRPNANPVCTRGAALVAVAPAARARSRGTEARVQEAHTRRKTERRSVRPRIRQRRSIASVWPFVHMGNRRFLKPPRRNRACSQAGLVHRPAHHEIGIPLPAFGTAQQTRLGALGFAQQEQRRQLRIIDGAATVQRCCARVRTIAREAFP